MNIQNFAQKITYVLIGIMFLGAGFTHGMNQEITIGNPENTVANDFSSLHDAIISNECYKNIHKTRKPQAGDDITQMIEQIELFCKDNATVERKINQYSTKNLDTKDIFLFQGQTNKSSLIKCFSLDVRNKEALLLNFNAWKAYYKASLTENLLLQVEGVFKILTGFDSGENVGSLEESDGSGTETFDEMVEDSNLSNLNRELGIKRDAHKDLFNNYKDQVSNKLKSYMNQSHSMFETIYVINSTLHNLDLLYALVFVPATIETDWLTDYDQLCTQINALIAQENIAESDLNLFLNNTLICNQQATILYVCDILKNKLNNLPDEQKAYFQGYAIDELVSDIGRVLIEYPELLEYNIGRIFYLIEASTNNKVIDQEVCTKLIKIVSGLSKLQDTDFNAEDIADEFSAINIIKDNLNKLLQAKISFLGAMSSNFIQGATDEDLDAIQNIQSGLFSYMRRGSKRDGFVSDEYSQILIPAVQNFISVPNKDLQESDWDSLIEKFELCEYQGYAQGLNALKTAVLSRNFTQGYESFSEGETLENGVDLPDQNPDETGGLNPIQDNLSIAKKPNNPKYYRPLAFGGGLLALVGAFLLYKNKAIFLDWWSSKSIKIEQ